MTLSKINTLKDVTVYVNESPVSGITSISESCTGTVHCVEAFGEDKPIALTVQDKRYVVKLCILGFDGPEEFFGKDGFEIKISYDISNIRYLNCAVSELIRGTDTENRLIATVIITADTKIKDVI